MADEAIELKWDDSAAEAYENGELLDDGWFKTYRVVTPGGQSFTCRHWYLRHWAALWERCGEIAIPENRTCVPVAVAVEGRGAIATFLWIVHHLHRDLIAEWMGVSRDTVRQYISDFRVGRR